MLNPRGGQGVCCTIAENENNISKPWLWMAQKHARRATSRKSQELSLARRPRGVVKMHQKETEKENQIHKKKIKETIGDNVN